MDWKSLFSLDIPLLEIILRGTVMYIALFILLPMVLKRQTGGLGMTDLLLITLIADASQNAMAGEYRLFRPGCPRLYDLMMLGRRTQFRLGGPLPTFST